MDNIRIERYDNPAGVGYQGWIEPKDRSWILYIAQDGSPLFYPHRAPDGGVLCEGQGPHNVPEIRRTCGRVMLGTAPCTHAPDHDGPWHEDAAGHRWRDPD